VWKINCRAAAEGYGDRRFSFRTFYHYYDKLPSNSACLGQEMILATSGNRSRWVFLNISSYYYFRLVEARRRLQAKRVTWAHDLQEDQKEID